jgi:hypothetical protein
MRKVLFLGSIMLLTGCTSPGSSQLPRGPMDLACGGVTVGTFGNGAVGLMPPGAVGSLHIAPNGDCQMSVTGWTTIPGGGAIPAVPPVPAVAPVNLTPGV